MGKTPKTHRKTSLSLRSRIRNKRQNSSPKSQIRTVLTRGQATTPKSIAVNLSSYTDCGIECTPPNKKLSFDDSLDCSQSTLDYSFSPSGLLSQTLAIESPEVCWKWNGGINEIKKGKITNTIATPDSAYAADSSFTSAGSSSDKCRPRVRTRSYDKRREDQRRAIEQQMRKAEKLKQDEMLKQRCARLQQQLDDAQLDSATQKQRENCTVKDDAVITNTNNNISFRNADQNVTSPAVIQNKLKSDKLFAPNKTLNDFFNDFDSDCLLLEATQQVESKIVESTQEVLQVPADLCTKKSPKIVPNSAPPAVSTPTSHTSFSKFLEDDLPDDWFVSLDEVILQATQSKKSGNSFQRHNSMPSNNIKAVETIKTAGSVRGTSSRTESESVSSTRFGKSLKRHASSNALSPSSACYKGHLSNWKK